MPLLRQLEFAFQTTDALTSILSLRERRTTKSPGEGHLVGSNRDVDLEYNARELLRANGATRIIPGSHLLDHSPNYGQHYDSIAAEMPKGSVLVWHGSLWHGGGANTTGDRRVGIAMNYCAGWIRQQENQQLGIPIDIARGFSPRLRELVGYSIYSGLIGHIDKHSPSELLDDASATSMVWDAART